VSNSPQAEHGFDLLLPRYAPAAQAALYDLKRFLALLYQQSAPRRNAYSIENRIPLRSALSRDILWMDPETAFRFAVVSLSPQENRITTDDRIC
jgi:hypothetical protein